VGLLAARPSWYGSGMSDEPENRAAKLDVKALRSELEDMKSDMRSLRADLASDLLSMRKELSDQIVGLRRAVIDYHTSVIGRGVLISDLDARMRRVEQHLNLPPLIAS
jgi:hypothetical protein